MKKEINVSYMRTINLGNYESAKIQAGITQEIFEKDLRTDQKIFEDLFSECEAFVLKQIEVEIGA
jgi:hypothetical protein